MDGHLVGLAGRAGKQSGNGRGRSHPLPAGEVVDVPIVGSNCAGLLARSPGLQEGRRAINLVIDSPYMARAP
jgi:hypothetical protein